MSQNQAHGYQVEYLSESGTVRTSWRPKALSKEGRCMIGLIYPIQYHMVNVKRRLKKNVKAMVEKLLMVEAKERKGFSMGRW